jgi:hypothetical protein
VLDLLVWIVALLQLLAQVGRTAAAGLPPLIASTFELLGAFQFQSVAVPAACWSGYAFKPQVTLMGVALGLSAALWLLALTRGRCIADINSLTKASAQPSRSCTPARRLRLSNLGFAVCFGLAALLYAPTANTVFGLLACTTTAVSPLAFASLDKDAGSGAVSSNGDSTVSVSVLTSNPSFVCYQGSHMPAGIMAWVTALLVTIGYPLWTLLWSRARIVSLVQLAMARELRLAPAHFKETSKQSNASKAVTLAVWKKLREVDTAAVRAGLQARPVPARLVYFCCGQERFLRWMKPGPAATASGGRSPRASQAALVSAVKGISRRDQADGTPTKAPAQPRPVTMSVNAKSPAAPDVSSASRKQRASAVGKAPAPSLATSAGAVPGLLLLEACNTCADVLIDVPLRPFVGSTFRASVSYAQQVDAVAMSVLAAIQWFWQRPASTGEVAGRACLYVLTLVATAWVIGTRNPFWPHDAWKLHVKVGSLLLAALAAVLTHFSLSMTLSYGDLQDTSQPGYATAADTRTGLAYAVFVGCILLALVLVVGFWAHTVTGARRETAESKEAARARSSFVAAAAGVAGLQLQPEAQEIARSAGDDGDSHSRRNARASAVHPRGSLSGRATRNPLGVAHPLPRQGGGDSPGGGESSLRARGTSRVRLSRGSSCGLAADESLSSRSTRGSHAFAVAASAALRRGSGVSRGTAGDDGAGRGNSSAGSSGRGIAREKPVTKFAPVRVGVSASRLRGSAAATAAAAASSGAYRSPTLLHSSRRLHTPATSASGRSVASSQPGRESLIPDRSEQEASLGGRRSTRTSVASSDSMEPRRSVGFRNSPEPRGSIGAQRLAVAHSPRGAW